MSDISDMTIPEVKKALKDGELTEDEVREAELATDSPRKGVLDLVDAQEELEELEAEEAVEEAADDVEELSGDEEELAAQMSNRAPQIVAGDDPWGKVPMQSRPREFRKAPDYS